jgi:hypothetical protein
MKNKNMCIVFPPGKKKKMGKNNFEINYVHADEE